MYWLELRYSLKMGIIAPIIVDTSIALIIGAPYSIWVSAMVGYGLIGVMNVLMLW